MKPVDNSMEEVLQNLQDDLPTKTIEELKRDVNLAEEGKPTTEVKLTTEVKQVDEEAPSKAKTKREAIKYDEEDEAEHPKKKAKQETSAEPIRKHRNKEVIETSEEQAVGTSKGLLRIRNPSPPMYEVTSLIHIRRLKRPFTIKQIQELLSEYGDLTKDGFWIDEIKTNCIAKFKTKGQAKLARDSLHGAIWPSICGLPLSVQYTLDEKLISRLKDVPDRLRNRMAIMTNKIEPVISKRESNRSHNLEVSKKNEKLKSKDASPSPKEKAVLPFDQSPVRKDRAPDKLNLLSKKEEGVLKDSHSLFKKTLAEPSICYLPRIVEKIEPVISKKESNLPQHSEVNKNNEKLKLKDTSPKIKAALPCEQSPVPKIEEVISPKESNLPRSSEVIKKIENFESKDTSTSPKIKATLPCEQSPVRKIEEVISPKKSNLSFRSEISKKSEKFKLKDSSTSPNIKAAFPSESPVRKHEYKAPNDLNLLSKKEERPPKDSLYKKTVAKPSIYYLPRIRD